MTDHVISNSQDPELDAVLATLRGLLTAGETLEAWAVQHRLFALTHRRACIAATSGRFISLNRRLLGGYESADIRWKDVKETRISAGIAASSRVSRANRVSELEELRAKSGGVQIGSGPTAYAGADAAGVESEPTRRLRQAREMLDAKLISDSEFESIKAKIVSGL